MLERFFFFVSHFSTNRIEISHDNTKETREKRNVEPKGKRKKSTHFFSIVIWFNWLWYYTYVSFESIFFWFFFRLKVFRGTSWYHLINSTILSKAQPNMKRENKNQYTHSAHIHWLTERERYRSWIDFIETFYLCFMYIFIVLRTAYGIELLLFIVYWHFLVELICVSFLPSLFNIFSKNKYFLCFYWITDISDQLNG